MPPADRNAPPAANTDTSSDIAVWLSSNAAVRNAVPDSMQRALAVAIYFLSGVVAINASQILAAPVSSINSEWYRNWMSSTKQTFGLLTTTMTQIWAPTTICVSGDQSMRGQLLRTDDGDLMCNFPNRLVLVANHQIYTDWLYLWWIAYTAKMHGHVYIILKESLKRIPFIGWGMQLNNFIFLKRDWQKDKPSLTLHMQRLNKTIEPMWLLLFPEGTNLARDTRAKSRLWAQKNCLQDMQHTLLPRSTGFRFCLQELKGTVEWVYDCTVAYAGVPRGQFAQDIYTLHASYVEGRPPGSVHMYWRRFKISEVPIESQLAFESWLIARWREKDRLIEYWYRHGKFPADDGLSLGSRGEFLRGAGHIESQVRANKWKDFLQLFAPMGLLAMVFFMFYGALPRGVVELIEKKAEEFGGKLAPGFGKAHSIVPYTGTGGMASADGARMPQSRFNGWSSGLGAAAAEKEKKRTISRENGPLLGFDGLSYHQVAAVQQDKAPARRSDLKGDYHQGQDPAVHGNRRAGPHQQRSVEDDHDKVTTLARGGGSGGGGIVNSGGRTTNKRRGGGTVKRTEDAVAATAIRPGTAPKGKKTGVSGKYSSSGTSGARYGPGHHQPAKAK